MRAVICDLCLRSVVELVESLAARLPPVLSSLIQTAAAAPSKSSSSSLSKQDMGDRSSNDTLKYAVHPLRAMSAAAEKPAAGRTLLESADGAQALASSSSSSAAAAAAAVSNAPAMMSFSSFASAAKSFPEFPSEAARQVHTPPPCCLSHVNHNALLFAVIPLLPLTIYIAGSC